MSDEWRAEITALIVEFCSRADSGRHAGLVELFARDGRFIFPDLPLESGRDVIHQGHEQLRQRWGARAPQHTTCHIVSMPCLKRTGDRTAVGTTNLISYRGSLEGISPAHEPFLVGRFQDKYIREDGRWVIAERRLVVQFAGETLRSGAPPRQPQVS